MKNWTYIHTDKRVNEWNIFAAGWVWIFSLHSSNYLETFTLYLLTQCDIIARSKCHDFYDILSSSFMTLLENLLKTFFFFTCNVMETNSKAFSYRCREESSLKLWKKKVERNFDVNKIFIISLTFCSFLTF